MKILRAVQGQYHILTQQARFGESQVLIHGTEQPKLQFLLRQRTVFSHGKQRQQCLAVNREAQTRKMLQLQHIAAYLRRPLQIGCGIVQLQEHTENRTLDGFQRTGSQQRGSGAGAVA